MDNIEKYYDESNWMDMSSEKDSNERDQISKTNEDRVTEDIGVFKLRKLISKKNDDNIEKEYDEIKNMDTGDEKVSDKGDQIDKNDEERVTYDIEVLKLGKLGSQKNIDNVEKETDKRNRMDMIDDEEYDERDQIGERKEDD